MKLDQLDTKKMYVWNVINPPAAPIHYLVGSTTEAMGLINRMADEQLKSPDIFANAFGLTVFEDGEWVEWHDDEGQDISDLMNQED